MRKSGDSRVVRVPNYPRLVGLAVLTLFFVQAVQQFIPAIYARSMDTRSIDRSAALILLFLSPFAYLLFGKVDPWRLVLPVGVVVAGLRVILAVPLGPDATLLSSGLVVATYLLYLPAHLLRRGASAGVDAAGFTLGFAGDAAARVLYFGSDPFATPWGIVPLVVAAGVAFLSLLRDRGNQLGTAPLVSKGMRGAGFVRLVFLGLGLGATLSLQMTLLAYPFVLARFVGASPSVMTLAVFIGFGLGVLVISRGIELLTIVVVPGNAAVVGAIIDLAWIASPILPVLMGIAELVIIANLAILFRYSLYGAPTLRAAGFAFGVGGVTFVTYVFAFLLTLAYAFVPARRLWEGRLPLLLAFTALVAAIPPVIFAWRSRVHGIQVEGVAGEARRVFSGAVVTLLVIASLGVLVTPTPPTFVRPSSIVVMTYNIHQGFGQDGRLGIERIAEVIRQANADIVALQESDIARISSGNQDAVRFLAARLGYYEAYGPPTRDQVLGVSILSRFPILRWETIFLPSLETQRVMVEADVLIGSQILSVYAAHFGLTEEERAMQAAFVRELTASAAYSRILLGDFNSVPRQPPSRQEVSGDIYVELTADWRDSWTAAGFALRDSNGFTWPAASPVRRIDYVFLGPGITVDSVQVPRNPLTGVASDHLPVIAQIRLPLA